MLEMRERDGGVSGEICEEEQSREKAQPFLVCQNLCVRGSFVYVERERSCVTGHTFTAERP
jgi:hypothetical protein